MKLLNKVNTCKIINEHFDTLKNNNSKKIEFDDILTFLMLPIGFASLLVYLKINLSESAINILITTLSILVGLLFNVIVIIFDIIKRDNSQRIKNELLNQLLTNISYSIILSLLIIMVTVLTNFELEFVHWIFVWIVYFLMTNYLMTVLMILKRMYLLFINELDEIGKH